MGETKTIAILQVRHLGDAVITTKLVEMLGLSNVANPLCIITRPQLARIFLHNPYVAEVKTVNFPVGTLAKFHFHDFLSLLGVGVDVRRNSSPFVVNTVGDVRENLFGWLIGRKKNHLTVKWGAGHPMRKQIRQASIGLASSHIHIPASETSIYRAMSLVAHYFGANCEAGTALYKPTGYRFSQHLGARLIGIHPFASKVWREWSVDNWIELARELINAGYELCIFLPPQADESFKRIFVNACGKRNVKFSSGSLDNFFTELESCRLLIGLDSFSVHAANALGVDVVMLSGPNDPRVWAPPNAVVINGGPLCQFYPCYNKPRCFGSNEEFVCMNKISVSEVKDAVVNRLNKTGDVSERVF